MDIGTVCTRQPVTIAADEPLAQVARLMHDRHVGTVIVVKRPLDRVVPAGIITDRDVVRAQVEQRADLAMLDAERVMTRDPLVLEERTPLPEGIRRMRERGVRRAPVVDATGALVGIVSSDDILAAIAAELGELARLLAGQPQREAGG
ncbi:MAG: CBS domain-containing protein [Gammaproteobacteria bacterium]|nr:CBS domain-containing protein [Gammaproteobacteria bacterium]